MMRLARVPSIAARSGSQKWANGKAASSRVSRLVAATPATSGATTTLDHRRQQHNAINPDFLNSARMFDRIYPKHDNFADRHLGPRAEDVEEMLQVIGVDNMESMVSLTVPESIRLGREMDLDPVQGESEMLDKLKNIAKKNKMFRSFIGLGYHNCHIPLPIMRNMLENPGWITQYTPYQAEIAQGRLTGLLNYQTMVTDLTGLDVANASLLDEATAAAEAMALCQRQTKRDLFYVDDKCHPHTIDLVKTRAG